MSTTNERRHGLDVRGNLTFALVIVHLISALSFFVYWMADKDNQDTRILERLSTMEQASAERIDDLENQLLVWMDDAEKDRENMSARINNIEIHLIKTDSKYIRYPD